MYYHLGAYEESLTYALGADDLFDVNESSEYVETTVGECSASKKKLLVNVMQVRKLESYTFFVPTLLFVVPCTQDLSTS